ncbi:MAG: DUF2949 domain-containing protein [Cyanobacteria bacterium J06621_11]
MKRSLESRFLRFLEIELGLSAEAITLALGQHREDLSLLPITLWKHQLVTIDQVGSMFDWLANRQGPLVQAP